jgi:phenylpyruvate tautomerase PptA (4-oxalocrotonate tautomerase family)
MALARIEILEGRTPEIKRAMVEAVRGALSEALQAPAEDPCVRLAEYPHGEFALPYPDRHSERFTLIEVTMFAGRSLETKRRLYDALVRALGEFEIDPHDVLIVLHEPAMESWGVEGGRPASEVDVGFRVEI